MSASVRLATPWTVTLSASTIVATGPSRVFTLRFWPSSFSIVPRTGVGGLAGGFCAPAGIAARPISAATKTAIQRMIPSLPVTLFGQKWPRSMGISPHISVRSCAKLARAVWRSRSLARVRRAADHQDRDFRPPARCAARPAKPALAERRAARLVSRRASFDRDGNLYVVNIPYGQVLLVSPGGEFTSVATWDGEPNGLKIHKDGRIFI